MTISAPPLLFILKAHSLKIHSLHFITVFSMVPTVVFSLSIVFLWIFTCKKVLPTFPWTAQYANVASLLTEIVMSTVNNSIG